MMADETENQTADSGPASQTTNAGAGGPSKVTAENLRVLENVEVQMTVEVGNTEIKIRDLLRLNEGAVIELDRLAGDPLDILVNGTMISLKGADRPETMRGVSLGFLVMDEYADMKPDVWEQILRPALADQKGRALFIGFT